MALKSRKFHLHLFLRRTDKHIVSKGSLGSGVQESGISLITVMFGCALKGASPTCARFASALYFFLSRLSVNPLAAQGRLLFSTFYLGTHLVGPTLEHVLIP